MPLLLDAGSSVRNDVKLADTSGVSVSWLLDLCRTVPSELDPVHLARAILEAAQRRQTKLNSRQRSLMLSGLRIKPWDVLMEVAPLLSEIRQKISVNDLESASQHPKQDAINSATIVDLVEERRQFLLREAVDAAQVAAVAQAEVDELTGIAGSNAAATHTILRTSEIRAKKFAEKAARRAAQAMQRAKDAGAIIDESELLSIDQTNFGDGGLMHRSQEEVWALQQSLLPEGSREYYDNRGLPRDAIRVEEDGMEKVIIPAAKLDKAAQCARLKIADIMDAELGKAFAGTTIAQSLCSPQRLTWPFTVEII